MLTMKRIGREQQAQRRRAIARFIKNDSRLREAVIDRLKTALTTKRCDNRRLKLRIKIQ